MTVRAGTDIPLVGRDAELDAVRQRLRRAAAGAREAIVLEGEAGIGKTRLLSECARMAHAAGLTVVEGAADDFEQARPYGVLLNAFQASRPDIAERLGSLPLEPSDRRLAFVDSLVSILDEVTETAPLALVLDDLHWADRETLRSLRALVRRTASVPFALVASCRPSTTEPELDALIDTVAYEGLHIDLEPLDHTAVSALADALSAGPTATDVSARISSAHGNPFFVIEIVSSSLDEAGAEIPRTLRRTILRRAIQLSADGRALLRVASLHGGAIDPEELAVVTGRPVMDLLPTLDEAVKARVLDEREGSLLFRHELLREAVYTDMPLSVRKKLHRDAARALASSGAPARRVAAHAGPAAERGDGEAMTWLRRAATEEMQRFPALAADMLGRAVDIAEPDDPTLEHIQVERVKALVWAGRVSEASALATDVLARLRDPTLAIDVRVALGQALFFQGRIQDAAVLLQAATSDADANELGYVLAGGALAMLLSGQLEQAASLADQALGEAKSTNDARALSLATAVRSGCMLVYGEPSAADVAREAVHIADEDFLGEAHRYGASAFLGYALTERDSSDEAVTTLRRGIERDQEHGITWALPIYHGFLGLQHFYRGEWDDSVAELETVKGLHEDMDSSLFGPTAHGILAKIAVHRDDLERADAEIAWGEDQLAERGPQEGMEYLMIARILVAEGKGDIATAMQLSSVACSVAQGMGLLLAFRYFAPIFARIARANGTPDESAFAVEAVERYAERSGIRSVRGIAMVCRGVLENDAEKLLEAVQVLTNAPRPLELAMAHEHAGLVLAQNGHATRAAEQFDEAVAVYERLGARLDVARVVGNLAEAGRGGKRLRAHRPVTGWESLSRTERRVAMLVAQGLSNGAVAERLVVSRRTVETHVYHVFQKLGLSSRAELVARAARESASSEAR